MDTTAHFSSKTDLWSTPQDFFDKLNAEFSFNLDVCATAENAKCNRFFTKSDDGLTRNDWFSRCWMNPPYGREIGKWIKKAHEACLGGSLVVCLIPARTDTSWWHEYVMQHEIRFIRGRLKFGNATNSAPFPSAIVVMKPEEHK
jgi:phage N-6-adenine-methyltransferase